MDDEGTFKVVFSMKHIIKSYILMVDISYLHHADTVNKEMLIDVNKTMIDTGGSI